MYLRYLKIFSWVRNKRRREVGFLCTNKQRALLQKVNTLLPETRLVDRFYLSVAAPPVSHHLNQRLPVSLFSHSHVASNKYNIATKFLYTRNKQYFTVISSIDNCYVEKMKRCFWYSTSFSRLSEIMVKKRMNIFYVAFLFLFLLLMKYLVKSKAYWKHLLSTVYADLNIFVPVDFTGQSSKT